MQVQCAKGLDEVGKVRESGTPPEAVAIQHTNGVLDIHKSCLAIAEEKVFLAVQTYDLVSLLTDFLVYFFVIFTSYLSSWCKYRSYVLLKYLSYETVIDVPIILMAD